jgi:hypothetical protein
MSDKSRPGYPPDRDLSGLPEKASA